MEIICNEKCAALRQVLLKLMPSPGDYSIGIDGLTLFRREETGSPQGEGCAMPHVTLVFQGAESVLCNRYEFLCEPCQLRFIRKDVVGTGCITTASAEYPFIAASLRLDLALLKAMEKTAHDCSGQPYRRCGAISVRAADTGLLDAFLRLIMLHENPVRIPVLATLIIQEIHYLLVVSMAHGQQGSGRRK